MSDNDDWEEQMIDRLVEMFKGMGMSLNKSQIKSMMEQFKSQFEKMGLDADKLNSGDVNFNFDLSNLSKMFQSGQSIEDILGNLGMDVKVDAIPVEIETPEIEDDNDEVLRLPSDDFYLDGWNMSITIDFALKGDIKEMQMEMNLSKGGSMLEIMKQTQTKPMARIKLPHPCEDVVGWSLNNGILDVTLKLTPQGSALKDSDDENPAADVSLDFGEDDDDDDDGGIPIF
ncbi:MAG TPA: hypothetical protein HA354_05170 [Candidatus Poseidoniaceae archaeon]|nr:hypothetical protein [Euryarchaeota archaeon]DAC57592.1 MAG TPA: hypothetical protein D7I07_05150 [Candidatus Poseidoniales archaeon]HII37868.1 hypothetical protein [Candidatus Poseidoniaceae archaeon]|tara:strand:+ start:4317 stop:5003 length:687 start_codon:yes stop_codon:yes gene_type:complete